MSILFRIAARADDRHGMIARINARQLAAFRKVLRAEGDRLSAQLLDPGGDDGMLAYDFEARVCPIALARLARIFDFVPAAVAVLDDAQFRRRRVRIEHVPSLRMIVMQVSLRSDLGLELDLAPSAARAFLRALGLHPDASGTLPIQILVNQLSDPHVRRRLQAQSLDQSLLRIERLLETSRIDDSSRLEWA